MAELNSRRVAPSVWLLTGKVLSSAKATVLIMPVNFFVTTTLVFLLQCYVNFNEKYYYDKLEPDLTIYSSFFCTIITFCLIAPLTLSIHRFILLGEKATFTTRLSIQRALQFTGWLAGAGFISAFATLIDYLFSPGTLIRILIIIGEIIVTIRFILIFPAIAIDHSDNPTRSSLRRTHGQFSYISKVMTLTILPLYLMFGALGIVHTKFLNEFYQEYMIIATLANTIFIMSFILLSAVYASWLFLVLPDI